MKNGNTGKLEKQCYGQVGIVRQEVLAKHYAVYGRMLDNNQLRMQILPMLETAGLIVQEQDQNDKRKMLIFPAALYQNSNLERISEAEEEALNSLPLIDKNEDDEIDF